MRILIINGRVIDPASNKDGMYDILIENDTIVKVEPHLLDEAEKIIDAEGLFVMPGFIDLHVHLREPGFEYKETIKTGTMAAARGGYTTICPMPNTLPCIDSKESVEWLNQKADKEAVVNIIPVGAVTKGQEGKELSEITGMKEAGAKALSEDGKSVMDISIYLEGMKQAQEKNMVILAHCEDKNLVGNGVLNQGSKSEELNMPGICNAVEDIITARDIFLAKETGAKLHLCHCSTKDSVRLVKMAKEMGLPVSAEVCPHHFTLTEDDILEDDSNYKMNPPLRTKGDKEALKKGLRDGIMDVIATDHAPHSQEEKKKSIAEAPFGIVGLETAFPLTMTELVLTGYLTPYEMVEKMSYNPAKVLGINKGSLKPGKIADIVIADPNKRHKILSSQFASKGKNTPFDNRVVNGKVIMTIVSGNIVYEESKQMQ